MPNRNHSPFSRQKPPAGSQVDWGHPLARGLTCLLPLNEGGGTSVFSPAGSLIAPTTGPTWTAGPNGRTSLNFVAASSQFVKMPASPSLYLAACWSIVVWFKTSSNGFQWLLGTAGSPGIWLGENSSHVLVMSKQLAGDRAGVKVIDDGYWHQAAVTYNSLNATQKLYVDGKLDASFTSVPDETSQAQIYLGVRGDGAVQYWNGQIDNLALFAVELSPVQIAQLYSEPFAMLRAPGRSSGKVAA